MLLRGLKAMIFRHFPFCSKCGAGVLLVPGIETHDLSGTVPSVASAVPEFCWFRGLKPIFFVTVPSVINAVPEFCWPRGLKATIFRHFSFCSKRGARIALVPGIESHGFPSLFLL